MRPPSPAQAPPNMIASSRTAYDLITQRMGGIVVLAHRPQDQATAGFVKEPIGARNQCEADIDHRVMLENDRPDDGDITQQRDVNVRKSGSFDPDVALPDQRRETQTKERQRKARRHLVGQQISASAPQTTATDAAPPKAAATKPSQGDPVIVAKAKPQTAPVIIMPSTPRFRTPARSTTSSPIAAKRIGVQRP